MSIISRSRSVSWAITAALCVVAVGGCTAARQERGPHQGHSLKQVGFSAQKDYEFLLGIPTVPIRAWFGNLEVTNSSSASIRILKIDLVGKSEGLDFMSAGAIRYRETKAPQAWNCGPLPNDAVPIVAPMGVVVSPGERVQILVDLRTNGRQGILRYRGMRVTFKSNNELLYQQFETLAEIRVKEDAAEASKLKSICTDTTA